MGRTVLQTITDPSGERRVLIFRGDDGLFGFEAQDWINYKTRQYWVKRHLPSNSICATEEIALREAIGHVDWLKDRSAKAAEAAPPADSH